MKTHAGLCVASKTRKEKRLDYLLLNVRVVVALSRFNVPSGVVQVFGVEEAALIHPCTEVGCPRAPFIPQPIDIFMCICWGTCASRDSSLSSFLRSQRNAVKKMRRL